MACPRCGERSDEGWLCSGCTRYTRTTLRSIHTDWPDLMDAFTKQRGLPTGGEGHGKNNTLPLPYDERAARTSHHIRATIASWCRLLHEDHQVPLPADRIGAMLHHLRSWLPLARRQAWSAEFADEISDLHRDLLAALQAGEGNQVTVPRAACPHCGGPLHTRINLDWFKNPAIWCSTCGEKWGAGAWEDLKKQSDAFLDEEFHSLPGTPLDGIPEWASATRIAEALGVSPGMIRTAAWRHGWERCKVGRESVYAVDHVAVWWEKKTTKTANIGT